MAHYQNDHGAQMVMIPVALGPQLMPGTLACAIHAPVQRRLDTSRCERTDHHEVFGCSA
jgi:hypothetical protein